VAEALAVLEEDPPAEAVHQVAGNITIISKGSHMHGFS